MNLLGYHFAVAVYGEVSKGAPASLSMSLKELPSEDAFNEIRAGVAWFCDLANHGGMGGGAISPTDCICDLNRGTEPQTVSTSLTWQFNKVTICPESLNVLFRLFHYVKADIQSVSFKATERAVPRDIAHDEFPSVFGSLPFRFSDSRESRNVEVRIEFTSDIPEQYHESIVKILQTWCLIGAMGGFDLPSPDSNMPMGIVPNDDPDIVLDLVEFVFRDNGINDTAYAILANICYKLHHEVQPIKCLEIL